MLLAKYIPFRYIPHAKQVKLCARQTKVYSPFFHALKIVIELGAAHNERALIVTIVLSTQLSHSNLLN